MTSSDAETDSKPIIIIIIIIIIPATWVEQNLDALCIRHMRVWLEMPVSACVSEIASLPKRMGGMGISSYRIVGIRYRTIERKIPRARSAPAARRKSTNMFCRTAPALLPSTAIPSEKMQSFLY